MVAVDAVDDGLLPEAEVLTLFLDELHGIVEASVPHRDRPHGAGLQDDSELEIGVGSGGGERVKLTM